MSRHATTVSQAAIARAIRAVKATGLPVVRVVVRTDGVSVETIQPSNANDEDTAQVKVANRGCVVIL